MPIRVVKVTGDEMREEASVEDKKKKKKMLIGGQAKLDKNKNNRIDSEDFELLRAGKKRGGVMKAKRGKFLRSDPTKPISSVQPSTTLPKDFVGKRKALGGSRSALGMLKGPAKAGALLGVALAVPVGKVLKKVQDKRKAKIRDKAKVKKMGGGLAAATERLKAQGKMGGGMMKPQKAVLGMLFRKKKKATPGMKMVESSPGGFGLLGRLAKKVGLQKGGGADTGRMGEIKSKLGVATNQINRMKIPGRLTQRDKEALKEISKIKGRKFKPLSTTQRVLDALKSPKPVAKKMGGGMMQPAMPMYKKGTMIKARGGGIAKTKPTKMY